MTQRCQSCGPRAYWADACLQVVRFTSRFPATLDRSCLRSQQRHRLWRLRTDCHRSCHHSRTPERRFLGTARGSLHRHPGNRNSSCPVRGCSIRWCRREVPGFRRQTWASASSLLSPCDKPQAAIHAKLISVNTMRFGIRGIGNPLVAPYQRPHECVVKRGDRRRLRTFEQLEHHRLTGSLPARTSYRLKLFGFSPVAINRGPRSA